MHYTSVFVKKVKAQKKNKVNSREIAFYGQ